MEMFGKLFSYLVTMKKIMGYDISLQLVFVNGDRKKEKEVVAKIVVE